MTIKPFKLEEYLTHYEFSAPYLLCCSDAQSFTMREIVELASDEERMLWDNLHLGYTETYGLPLLRQTITQTLYKNLSFENILCFSGAQEGIFISLYLLCEADDHVIVLTPCYQSLLEIPRLKGAIVSEILLREERNWRIDIEEIKDTLTPQTKMIVINFPHNPTGQVITQEDLQDLVDLCRKHNIWLFSDEVYHSLGHPSKPWATPAACLYEKGISLGVMSKSLGMPGVRVGWIACQDKEIIHTLKQMKDYLSICNSAPSEILSLIALQNHDILLQRNNEIVASNLTLLDGFVEKHTELFEWVRPEGGCVGFVKYKKIESIDIFCNRLVQERGVLLMPASVYDYPSNHFRIGFGRSSMPESLEIFTKFLKKEKD